MIKKIKERTINSAKNTAKIIEKEIKKTDAISTSVCSINSLKRTIQRTRNKFSNISNNMHLLEEIIFDWDISKIKLSNNETENIVKFDSGMISNDQRIIIFSTNKNLTYLNNQEEILIDGTFLIVPRLFYQLYTIHGKICGKLQPLIFALLSSKNTDIYKLLFRNIKNFQ